MAKSEFQEFKKQLYESYKLNMKFYGRKIKPYREWLKDVNNVKIDGNESK